MRWTWRLPGLSWWTGDAVRRRDRRRLRPRAPQAADEHVHRLPAGAIWFRLREADLYPRIAGPHQRTDRSYQDAEGPGREARPAGASHGMPRLPAEAAVGPALILVVGGV